MFGKLARKGTEPFVAACRAVHAEGAARPEAPSRLICFFASEIGFEWVCFGVPMLKTKVPLGLLRNFFVLVSGSKGGEVHAREGREPWDEARRGPASCVEGLYQPVSNAWRQDPFSASIIARDVKVLSGDGGGCCCFGGDGKTVTEIGAGPLVSPFRDGTFHLERRIIGQEAKTKRWLPSSCG